MSVEQYERKMGRYQDTLNKTQQQQKLLQEKLDRKNIADTRFGEARRSLFATAATASVVARPFISAAQTAMKFEFAMSKVGAIANATGPELTLLTQTARSLGEQTKFTATQSAEAMSYLGMAGWKTKEIVAGMPGLLNLAAAGNTDLASEYPTVILLMVPGHYIMLQRNLLYTAVTRARQKVILVGTKAAVQTAVDNDRTRKRYSLLAERLQEQGDIF